MPRALLSLFLAALLALSTAAQATWPTIDGAWRKIEAGGSYTGMTAPTGCAANEVAVFFGTPPYMGCADATYTLATKTLDTEVLSATNVNVSGLATPGAITVTPTLSQTATITTVAAGWRASGLLTVVDGASLLDGETFNLNDGVNIPQIFEFDPAGDGVVGGHVTVAIVGTETAPEVGALCAAAINATTSPTFTYSAVDNLDGTVTLQNTTWAATGNAAQSETVLDAGFSVTNMTGGVDAGIIDGDYFTVKYGLAALVPIEFDIGDGTTGGRVPLVFNGTETADDIRDAIIALLNTAAPAALTASNGGAATVNIVLDVPGVPGDTNTENVGDAAFAVTGFVDPTAATTWTYKLVARLANGATTEAGAASSTAAGVADLTTADYNALSWSAVTGATDYVVYRTAVGTTPATTGIIYTGSALSVDDTGLAGGGETAPTVDATGLLWGDGLRIGTSATIGHVLTADANGYYTPQAGGGISGLTTNYLTKSATASTVQNTAIVEASAGSLATTAGTALGLTATAPAATTGASQAGKDVTITASDAVASTDTAGAAAGGALNFVTGAAARNASGNADGGDFIVTLGAGIGTGAQGHLGFDANYGWRPLAAGWAFFRAADASSASRLSIIGSTTAAYGKLGMASGGEFGFSSTADSTAALDTFLRRRAAANPAWGAASATPVAYTHSLAADSRAGTDTNVGGANATLLPGIGTGTGTASRLLLGGPVLGSTGSTVQSTATPVSIGGEVKADGTESFLNVTGTLPSAAASGNHNGVAISVTGAGSGISYIRSATRSSLLAGYTGTRGTAGVYAENASTGGGNAVMSPNLGAAGAPSVGVFGTAAGTGTADLARVGMYGYGTNSAVSGAYAFGVVGSGASATNNVGVFGHVAGTAGTANIAGLFCFGASTPALVSAALVASNGSIAAPIFLGRDNGTTVFSVNDGGGVNMMREVEANTAGSGAPNVLVATESHKVLTNEGSTAQNYHTLPTAAAGLTFTFIAQDADGIRAVANTGDTIRVMDSVTAAGGYIRSSVIGSVVTLVAVNDTEWIATSIHGTWDDGTFTYDDTSLITP